MPTATTRRPIVASHVDAPWGPVRVAASAAGVVAVDQLVNQEAFRARLVRRFGVPPIDVADVAGEAPPPPMDPQRTGAVRHLALATEALERFFAGDLHALDGIVLDLGDRSGWDRLVLGAVRTIPPGTTASYGDVARMIGKAGAARAVGGAVGRNPVGLVIPCHRVIAGDGTLGGYGGGWWGDWERLLDVKADLLAAEGVHLPRSHSRGRGSE